MDGYYSRIGIGLILLILAVVVIVLSVIPFRKYLQPHTRMARQ